MRHASPNARAASSPRRAALGHTWLDAGSVQFVVQPRDRTDLTLQRKAQYCKSTLALVH